MGKVKRPEGTSANNFSQTVGVKFSKRVSASSELAFAFGINGSFKTKPVSDTVSFSDSVTNLIPLKEYPFEVLNLTQTVSVVKPTRISVTDSLGLVQTVTPTIHSGVVSSELVLTSTATGVRPRIVAISHNMSVGNIFDLPVEEIPAVDDPDFVPKLQAALYDLTLRQSVEVRRSVINVSVSTPLSLGSGFNKAAADTQAVSSHIHLSDAARTVLAVTVTSNLIFSDGVTAQEATFLWDRITFSQSASYTAIWTRALTSTSAFTQFLDGQGLDGSPISDPTGGAHAPLGDNLGTDYRQVQGGAEVTLIRTNTVTFTYPYSSPTLTVVLRTPKLGDRESLNYRRIARNTRGGRFELYRRGIWPKWNRHQMTFSALTVEQRRLIFDLLHESVGKDVGFLDHEGRQWRGIITTPAALVQEMGKLHQHEVTLEFQGELV